MYVLEISMIIDLTKASNSYLLQAAAVLKEAFLEKGVNSWDTDEKAWREVCECIQENCFALAYIADTAVLGWIGFRPMYAKVTWEMHPLAVAPSVQGQGIGRRLLQEGEKTLKERGGENIVLGTDDETGRTSLSGKDFTQEKIFPAIESIQNLHRHPFEFYQKQGYTIVGIIPDANGKGKPDIIMWKRIINNN